ncbi:MAG: hypothetical protein HY591_00810 [Candidatus Omnitrophica bacterium]|nr:hypothetical protein [Candidatus Omnitrophota bacterium]
MKLNIFFFSMFLLYAATSFATPPSDMSLTYDKEKNIVHVSAKHPSGRLERHYVRRLVIYKNDGPVETLNFPRQKLAAGLEEDIELKAGPGDRISIEAFCSQGGSGKAQIEIPQDKPEG